MAELITAKPRFIIEVLENKPWPQGPDTSRSFPELQIYLDNHYVQAQKKTTYRILERANPGQEENM